MQKTAVLDVEARLTMPDEKDNLKADWSMPDPVYRSTQGRDLKAERYASELPTETADRDLETVNPTAGSQIIRPKTNRQIRHKNKRRKSFWERNAAGLIVLGVLLLGALFYAAWFYRGKLF